MVHETDRSSEQIDDAGVGHVYTSLIIAVMSGQILHVTDLPTVLVVPFSYHRIVPGKRP